MFPAGVWMESQASPFTRDVEGIVGLDELAASTRQIGDARRDEGRRVGVELEISCSNLISSARKPAVDELATLFEIASMRRIKRHLGGQRHVEARLHSIASELEVLEAREHARADARLERLAEARGHWPAEDEPLFTSHMDVKRVMKLVELPRDP